MAVEDMRPIGARVSASMVGSSTGAVAVKWTERDAMLYALGVGAGLGDPARELAFTTENSESVRLVAVPSFLTVLAMGLPPAMAALDVGRFLHAGQRIELERPLPPSGCGTVETAVVEVLDKGAGAIITYVATLRDGGAKPSVVGRMRSSIFVRGAGGFGGPRGASAAAVRLKGKPDVHVVQETRSEQALLYRLSGDRHPLHSDPAYAAARGFDRPIMHGLCTFGFACRALIEGVAGGEAGRLRAMEGRFMRPAFPGGRLTTEIWRVGDGEVTFRTLDDAGDTVLDAGTATIGG